MTCLAVDTSGVYASVAVTSGTRVLCEFSLSAGRTHSETLMPLIDRAFEAARLRPDDIDLFAAVAGPGSFTGVRIGVLTIKAFAHAGGKPCAALSTLEVLAEDARHFSGTIAPMLDARRDQVYAAAFSGEMKRMLPDEALSISEFFEKLPAGGKLYFTGDGALAHAEEILARFGARAALAPECSSFPRAAVCGALALARPDIWTDYAHLLPVYLRKPQAERERAENGRR